MINFTCALYLGLRHESRRLKPWERLSMGAPAALVSTPDAQTVAQKLAALQGCKQAVLATSTLHLFWDLFGVLASRRIAIYMDSGVYPIARWGIERAVSRGALVRSFPHYKPNVLLQCLKKDARRNLRPMVVANGFCPCCGEPAPITAYLENVQSYGGLLILDDTQALGILGHSPSRQAPYGWGGGGALHWSKIESPHALLISSLAKGFGVPMAVMSGSSFLIKYFTDRSETRVHCSPPSAPLIRAAEHALDVNQKMGDSLRLRLANLVRYFRCRLAEAGFSAVGGLFPMQTLNPVPGMEASIVHRQLQKVGVDTVLQYSNNRKDMRITFIITVVHTPEQIDYAVNMLGQFRDVKIKNTKCSNSH